MQIHQLDVKQKFRSRKKVGRGGKRGTYSGHGGKGQTARSGRNFRPIVRDTLKRYPKLRGYKNRPVGYKATGVAVARLDAKFADGAIVTPDSLVEKKIVARIGGKCPKVKILGGGTVTKKLNVKRCAVSKSAKEKIEKAGGTIK